MRTMKMCDHIMRIMKHSHEVVRIQILHQKAKISKRFYDVNINLIM